MTVARRRALGAGQLALGLAELVRPAGTVRALAGRGAPVPDPRIVRVLGARQTVQGLVTLARPRADVTALGAGVDALHAASLVPLLLASRYRRAALVSTVLAVAAAAAGVASADE